MSNFQVGQRVRCKYAPKTEVTITEITGNGFKWELDQPVTIHPLLGSYVSGECFDSNHYEAIEQ